MKKVGALANRRYLAATLAVLLVGAPSAWAFMEDTRLLELRSGSSLSAGVQAFQSHGYELSNGTRLTFGDWYRAKRPEVRLRLLTAVSSNLGLIWGLGTGEDGGQYDIDPSLHLGFITRTQLTPRQTLSFSVTGILGGKLKEDACIASYGALGGTQAVNCRLAATPMRPSDTLKYLFNESPADRLRFTFSYDIRF